jgi:PAS domain S-box-containing protein
MTSPTQEADQRIAGFFEAVVAGLPEAVIVAEPGGRITFVNAATEALFGYGFNEVVGREITMLVPRNPDRRADPVKWLARWAVETDPEQSRHLDLTARRLDGREMPVEVRVRQAGIAGQTRYLITVRDNTLRRQEQAALKDANLRAARILMVAEDGMVSVDAEQKIIFFNLAAERMFGYRADEVLGQPLSLLLPPAVRAEHPALVESFRVDKRPSRMMGDRPEVRGCRRSGETFPLEATITKVTAAGALTFTAHLRDVTERNRGREALEERERRIRAVFDHASEPIALLAPDGTIIEINRAAAALTADDRTLAGAPLWEAPWLGAGLAAEENAGEPLRAAIAMAAAGQATALVVELERDGRALPIEVRLTPIADGSGAIAYVLAEGRFKDLGRR